jgi:hypothetical protein
MLHCTPSTTIKNKEMEKKKENEEIFTGALDFLVRENLGFPLLSLGIGLLKSRGVLDLL